MPEKDVAREELKPSRVCLGIIRGNSQSDLPLLARYLLDYLYLVIEAIDDLKSQARLV